MKNQNCIFAAKQLIIVLCQPKALYSSFPHKTLKKIQQSKQTKQPQNQSIKQTKLGQGSTSIIEKYGWWGGKMIQKSNATSEILTIK